ncbi:ribosome maturation factor RimM [Mycoplasma putrefaciens]|uniref:Ribosome maturation factor RimM n=1 Tax=Mycoplasma putrefaciens Mput9231 TaxID=1292033 RepID=M9WBZ5_9MOLU|nr:16S rRNA processing protein RimM [Mycoplasma putrefaciens]AGJ90687.1 16S rRNA processing protein RimM [Mycoplasma putrefaciens Mput9231]
MNHKLIEFGTISNTFGIKGLVKIVIDSDVIIDDLKKIDVMFTKQQNTFQVLRVENINLVQNKNYILCKFFNIDNTNQALKLKNARVYSSNRKNNISKIKSLIGFKFESDKTIGTVVDYMNNKSQELVKIKAEDKLFWVPIVDLYILLIDWENEIIKARNIEGLK